MIAFIASFAVGVGVGVAYGLLNVRSPAPPVIALLGLLGMLVGERAVTTLRSKATAPASIGQGELRADPLLEDSNSARK